MKQFAERIPGENLEILESKKMGDMYTLKRAYSLDVNIPDIAKKFLKDAFRLQRTDISDLAALTSDVKLRSKFTARKPVVNDVSLVMQHK